MDCERGVDENGMFVLEWDVFRRRYQALDRTTLIAASVVRWLADWSDVEKDIWERRVILKRARYLDSTDATREVACGAFHSGFTASHLRYSSHAAMWR
jgi:hypothetical protein